MADTQTAPIDTLRKALSDMVRTFDAKVNINDYEALIAWHTAQRQALAAGYKALHATKEGTDDATI